MAEIRGVEVEEWREQLMGNAFRAYGITCIGAQ